MSAVNSGSAENALNVIQNSRLTFNERDFFSTLKSIPQQLNQSLFSAVELNIHVFFVAFFQGLRDMQEIGGMSKYCTRQDRQEVIAMLKEGIMFRIKEG